MNYTKGKWKFFKGKTDPQSRIPPNGQSFWNIWIVGEDEKAIAQIHGDDTEVLKANAHLIAAAPKMAQLLERLVNDGWNTGISEEAKEILATIH